MTRPARKPLQERLADIERRLEVLETVARTGQSVGAPTSTAAPAAPPVPVPVAPEATEPPPLPPDAGPRMLDVERLFRWAGGILLILAAAFLLSVALDRGWLTPVVRLVGGLAIGGALMGFGVALRRRSDAFATTLLTSGAVITYLMVWAGYQAYELIGAWVAGAGMLIVVAGLFVEVFRSNDVALSVLATLGGFATPFLLVIAGEGLADTTGISIPIIAYLGAFVVLTGVVHVVVGWRLFQVVAAGLAVVAGVLLLASGTPTDGWRPDAIPLSLYFLLIALAHWAVPAVLRRSIEARRETRPPVHSVSRAIDDALALLVRAAGFVLLPILLAVVAGQWAMDPVEAGRTALVLAAGAALVGALASDLDDVINWLLAAVMLAIGLVLVLEEDYHALAIAGEGVAILVAGHYARGHRANAVAGHVLVALGSVMAGVRLLAAFGETGVAVPAVAALVVLLLVAAGWVAEDRMRAGWWGVAYVGSLLLLRHLFGSGDVGIGLTTGVWAMIGLGLVLGGRRRFARPLEVTGLLTLGAVAVRLLEHLGDLEPLVRVAVFLGIGALLLVGGWYLRPVPGEEPEEAREEHPIGV